MTVSEMWTETPHVNTDGPPKHDDIRRKKKHGSFLLVMRQYFLHGSSCCAHSIQLMSNYSTTSVTGFVLESVRTHILLCLSISALFSSSSFFCFSSTALLLLIALPKISILSGGEAALSLSRRDVAVFDLERERDSLFRLLLDSRDFERLFLSLSRDLDRERLRFLLCLLFLECLEREELRLRERPISNAVRVQ